MVIKIEKIALNITLIFSMVSCASTNDHAEFKKSKVIERIANKDETPSWATGEIAMFEEGQDVIFANIVSMSGNSRPEACMKASELEARSQMLRHIKDNIVASGQLNEAGATQDPAYESLTAFFSSGKISGSKVVGRYWQRVEESDESRERVLRLQCATKVSVKKQDLLKQMRDAMGVPSGDPKVRDALNQATTNFIDGLASEPKK